MNLKLVGAICIIIGCGGVGFRMASEHLRQESMLRQLITVLDYMESELQYRAISLPQLCRQAAKLDKGLIFRVFAIIADELDSQIAPNAEPCVMAAVGRTERLPESIRKIFCQLGKGLGCFDMEGQMKSLQTVRESCEQMLKRLLHCKESRIRSYQTLGLCAGAAIVILFV